jgi:hypothetical protein
MADGDDLVVGKSNDASSGTSLHRTGPIPKGFRNVLYSPPAALEIIDDELDGLDVYAPKGDAISGASDGQRGVYGESNEGIGVHGYSNGYLGVRGEGAKNGVSGAGLVGVVGEGGGVLYADRRPASIIDVGRTDGIGVRGIGAIGVWGDGVDFGILGHSETGGGVFGDAGFEGTGPGVAGQGPVGVSGEGPVGVRGIGWDIGKGSIGVHGKASGKGNWAGLFDGGLLVAGPKMAAVPHRDGTHRGLYCVESPESWFEDFGNGRLVRGKALIKIPRDFAAVVRTSSYHVFITPEADSNGLYVAAKKTGGFEVREQQGGRSSIAFSYRIVARRKDIPGPRLPKVSVPTVAKPARISSQSRGRKRASRPLPREAARTRYPKLRLRTDATGSRK